MSWFIKLYKRLFVKECKELATGVGDGDLFLKALGLQDKHVRSLTIKIDATEIIEVEVVLLAAKGEVGDLVKILQGYKKVNG